MWPGKRMPGHMGYEWVLASGLEVMRINPTKQVIYVKGACPGDVGEMVLIKVEVVPIYTQQLPV